MKIGCQCGDYVQQKSKVNYLRQGGNVFARLCLFVCLSVSQQDNSKSYGRIFLKFWGHVGNGKKYQWFNFGGDTEGVLDSGSLWNFRYHCLQWGIREPLANRRWCCHLANNTALAEVCGLWLLSSYWCDYCELTQLKTTLLTIHQRNIRIDWQTDGRSQRTYKLWR